MSLLSNYGFVILVFTSAFFILVFLLKNYYLNLGKAGAEDTHRRAMLVDNTNDLLNHPFFSNLKYRILTEIPSINFGNTKPVRKRLYSDLLIILFETLYDKSMDIANKQDVMDEWTTEKWVNFINDKITEVYSDFCTKALSEGIPNEVIVTFNHWNRTTTAIIYQYTSNFSDSEIFKSNVARTNTLFFIFNLLVVVMIADAEKTLKYLNGEISGKYYKEKMIE
jgi:hypothetical protein